MLVFATINIFWILEQNIKLLDFVKTEVRLMSIIKKLFVFFVCCKNNLRYLA